MTTQLESSALTADDAFQPRIRLNMDHVYSMVNALKDDQAAFDKLPIKVWKIGESLMIVDGFHRFKAFQELGFKQVTVDIHETIRKAELSDEEYLNLSRREALRYAITANQHNGSPLRRSRADNQRAIRLLLDDPISRMLTDAVIGDLVGVTGSTVASIRKQNPEYQTDERVGSDGRTVNRERLASNAGKLSKLAPSQAATSVALLAEGHPAQEFGSESAEEDFSGTRQVDYATLSADDAEEVSDFREKFDAPVEATNHAKLEVMPTTLDLDSVLDNFEYWGTSPVDDVAPSLSDAEQLRQFNEQLSEVRQLWIDYRDEILERQAVDLRICDLRAFGRAIFDYTTMLKEEMTRANTTAFTAPANLKPATNPQAEPALHAAAQVEADDWEERLLALSPTFEPIVGRVRDGISNGWDWKSFSNNRAWKITVQLVGKSLRDEAATLIQNLLKVAQSA